MPLPPEQWRALCVPPVIEAIERRRLALKQYDERRRAMVAHPCPTHSLHEQTAKEELDATIAILDGALRDL
jgi:hypothetical protein